MPAFMTNVCALTIATLYYAWRDGYRRHFVRRNQVLRERVACLLWYAAQYAH